MSDIPFFCMRTRTAGYVVASIGSYTTHPDREHHRRSRAAAGRRQRNRDAYFLIGSVNDGTITKGLRAAITSALRALWLTLIAEKASRIRIQATAAAALMELMRKELAAASLDRQFGYGFHVYWPLETSCRRNRPAASG